MSVIRYDLNKCIGCQHCVTVCPMDVFRFDYDAMKSVIAYPENCQSCGQCYVGCQGRSLLISNYQQSFAVSCARAAAYDCAMYQPYVDELIVATITEADEEEETTSSWSS